MRTPSTHDINNPCRSIRAGVAERRAVTIVELVIAIMVMGIMAAVAAPAFFETLLYHRVESAARRVKADLELARYTARLKSATQSVTFTNTGYSLSAAVDGLNVPTQAYAVDLTTAPYELSNVSANFTNALTVAFNGYGTPTSGGTVVLTLQQYRCTVTVDGVTGEITITRSHSNDASSSLPALPAVDGP